MIKRFKWIIVATIVVLMSLVSVSGQERKELLDEAELRALIANIKLYDWGQSRADLIQLENMIAAHSGSPDTLYRIEQMLITLLTADRPLTVRDFVCRQLSIFGTTISIPALSLLLQDDETEHLARYALERIPGQAADKALLETLYQTTNPAIQMGIATTLGQRRCTEAVYPLGRMALGCDIEAGIIAVRALGMISSPDAIEFLLYLRESSCAQRKTAALDALLVCADNMTKNGCHDAAIRVYEILYTEENPALIRAAALTGLAQINGKQVASILPQAILNEDVAVQNIAIWLVAQINDVELLESVVSLFARLPDFNKVKFLAALAANGSPIGQDVAKNATHSGDRQVRMAAYRALGSIGNSGTVMCLAKAAATATERGEQDVARQTLYQLRCPDVTVVMERQLSQTIGTDGNEMVAIELIRAIGERRIKSANPLLFEAARHQSRAVANQALRVIQLVGGTDDASSMADLLAARPFTVVENTAVILSNKISDLNHRAKAFLNRFDTLDSTAAKASFLRVMGRLGDVHSIPTILLMYTDEDDVLSEAAFHAMTHWLGSEFREKMRRIAMRENDESQKVPAFRAYIRMLSDARDLTVQERVAALIEAMEFSGRPQEQWIVLSALGAYGTEEALRLAMASSTDPALKAEAEVAAISISEKLMNTSQEAVRISLKNIINQTTNETIKEQAKRLLEQVSKCG